MRRGEVWWASLPAPDGSAPGYRRPVVVVQANDFNDSAIRTVVVLPLTTNLQLAAAPGNVLCRRRETPLTKHSVANVSQPLTLDKTRLTEKVATLPATLQTRIDEGLRVVLAL